MQYIKNTLKSCHNHRYIDTHLHTVFISFFYSFFYFYNVFNHWVDVSFLPVLLKYFEPRLFLDLLISKEYCIVLCEYQYFCGSSEGVNLEKRKEHV